MNEETLAHDEVRIHLKQGLPYVMPRIALDNTLRLLQKDIQRVEYPKPPEAEPAKPQEKVGKTKASLLGTILKDNKVTASELIEWIEKSNSFEDIGIVMNGETRKTVKEASKKRINEIV